MTRLKTPRLKTPGLKTLTAIAVVFSAIASPVFAQEAGTVGKHHSRIHALQNHRGVYNRVDGPLYSTPRTDEGRNIEDFGFSARDRSVPGGEDTSLNPSGS